MKKNLIPAIGSTNGIGRILTNEEKVSFAQRNCLKLPKKQMVKRILSFINNNNVSKADKKFFNKILGDTKILNKLQICTDGSYLNGRIFYKNFFNGSENVMFVDGTYWSDQYVKNNYVNISTLEKLNYMKYNFEVIYLHLVGNSKALDDKLWQDEMDELMPKWDDWDDYDEYHEESLLTNFGADQFPIYEMAVKDFGDTSLYIDNQAYDRRGNLIGNYYALRTNSNKDRSDFWKLFRGIRDGISA